MKNLSSVIFRFVVLLASILTSTSVYSQFQCPVSCSCANKTVSVTCFGANPNDDVSDTTSIQAAIDSVPANWTVYFPTGKYKIDSVITGQVTPYNDKQGLVIEKDNINLLGDGVGSELYTPKATNFVLLQIPGRNAISLYGYLDRVIPKNISIQKLSFSGQKGEQESERNRGVLGVPPSGCPDTMNDEWNNTALGKCNNLFGIFIFQAENVSISDVQIRDFGIDGVNVGLGNYPNKNITLERLKTKRIRRNAVHFGNGENLILRNSLIEDSQDNVWLPALGSGGAVDLETEGLDQSAYPITRVPYVYNLDISNNLIISPMNQKSKGGIALQFSGGPARKLNVNKNIVINSNIFTSGIANSTCDLRLSQNIPVTTPPTPPPAPCVINGERYVDPRLGESGRIREVNISSNWVSNLHECTSQFCDDSSVALLIATSGDVPDSDGSDNGVTLNNNVLSVFQNGNLNRIFSFSTNKNISGNNNKVFRPYVTIPPNTFMAGAYNFLWDKRYPSNWYYPYKPLGTVDRDFSNYNMQILNTIDNGSPESRLNCYTPPVYPETTGTWEFCNNLAGTELTWVSNPNQTPTTAPTITKVSVKYSRYLWVGVHRNINNEPVRVEFLHNGFPVGLKDVIFDGSNLDTKTFIKLNSKAKKGDVFKVMAFSETGKYNEINYTY
jgi:Pectate lyase superfamily protein